MQQPATQTTQQTQQTQSPDNSGLYPGMDATQVSEIDDYFRNNSNISSLGQYQNPYFTGDGFTDGQQDAAGVIPGAGAAANATTNASTNPNLPNLNPDYADQDWYRNMTDEQRDAYDAFIANGGIYGGGFVNTPGTGGFAGNTGTTKRPVPVVEAIQNLTVNRDPAAAQSSVATQFGLTGAQPVQAPSTNPFRRPETQQGNPFRRPETQQGIGSLAGGG
jgi:hypothetical protein